jgi:UDP-N-acetylglucosamine 2-epimerase (non-hydrolysing)
VRILTVFGTRPEAIKLAPVLRRLGTTPGVESLVCVTAQHRAMLDQVLELFGIAPEIDLDLMRDDQSLTDLTTAILQRLAPILAEHQPDRVIVQGDTTSAFAAALAAFYAGVPVAHVEAGLRSFDLQAPWPEELNRKLISGIADRHFAPTQAARDNLLREAVPPATIHITGNTVIDALHDALAMLDADPARSTSIHAALPTLRPGRRRILVTGHRRENFAGGLARVADALCRLADRGDVDLVYPVHLNPHVRRVAADRLANHQAIYLIPPLDYLPFIALMRQSTLIITDSGGVQEEAPALGKPVLVTRDITERPEAVAAGTVELVGTDTDRIVARANRLLDDQAAYATMSVAHNPYGDGHAAPRIVKVLCDG